MNILWALFSFKGRMRRRDFNICNVWMYVLTMWMFERVIVQEIVTSYDMLLMSLLMVAQLATKVKRLRDRDYHLAWLLVTLIPVIGIGFEILELMIKDGTAGPNRYGPDPKGRGGKPQDGNGSSDVKKEKDVAIFEG